jgi:hypothetical protein
MNNWTRNCVLICITAFIFLWASGVAFAGEPAGEIKLKPAADEDKPEAKPAAEATATAIVKVEPKKGYLSKKKFRITPYGHLRLDCAYDDSRTNSGNNCAYVKPVKTRHRDDEMNITHRHTRLGMLFEAPVESVKASGKLEFDFYNKGGVEDSAGVRLRQAFGKFAFKGGWSILFGQANDVVAPRVPGILNTAVLKGIGNVGHRRPQLRLSKTIKGDSASLEFAAAACRAYSAKDHDNGGTDDGEDAAVPDGQFRIGFEYIFASGPKADAKKDPKIEFGVWGFTGRREVDYDKGANVKMHAIGGYGADWRLTLPKGFSIEGEVWGGTGYGSIYKGGVLQDINKTLRETIDARGYWLQLGYKACSKCTLYCGFGCDNPDDDDLNTDNRSLNKSKFANIRYNVTKSGWIGLEYQYIGTSYLGTEDEYGDNRVQLTFCMSF